MAARVRLFSALCALVAAVIVGWQTALPLGSGGGSVQLRSTSAPMTNVSTTIKYPVLETVDPDPFDPCRDIPLDVIQRIGLAHTPPTPEDNLLSADKSAAGARAGPVLHLLTAWWPRRTPGDT